LLIATFSSCDNVLSLMQNHTLLAIMWEKSKPEVEFQHGSRLFSIVETLVSQLWIEVEKLQIQA